MGYFFVQFKFNSKPLADIPHLYRYFTRYSSPICPHISIAIVGSSGCVSSCARILSQNFSNPTMSLFADSHMTSLFIEAYEYANRFRIPFIAPHCIKKRQRGCIIKSGKSAWQLILWKPQLRSTSCVFLEKTIDSVLRKVYNSVMSSGIYIKYKRYLPQGRALNPAPAARDCGTEPRGIIPYDVCAHSVIPHMRGATLVSLDNKSNHAGETQYE